MCRTSQVLVMQLSRCHALQGLPPCRKGPQTAREFLQSYVPIYMGVAGGKYHTCFGTCAAHTRIVNCFVLSALNSKTFGFKILLLTWYFVAQK